MFKKFAFPILLIVISIFLFKSNNFTLVATWVAIFLLGMRFMQDWFKNFTGWSFEKILQKGTDKTWKSILFWAVSAALMQSSSIVWVITIWFLSAQLINLAQGIGITLWANIGTTAWIWMFAFLGGKISIWALWMPLIVLWIISMYQKEKIVKWIWHIFAWLGFVLVWTQFMQDWFNALKNTIDLSSFAVEGFSWVLIFTTIGLCVTIVVQSSYATIILVLAALTNGQVSYENALAIIIWANIGTNFTSFLVALTGNKDWKRVWLHDLILKIVAALLFIIFFNQIVWIIDFIANIIWIWSDNYTMRLPLFHTLFNITWVTIMLVFVKQMVIILKKVFPDENLNAYWNIYLNKEIISLPDTAIISLIKETRHLYYNATEVILEALSLKQSDINLQVDYEELKKKIKILEIEEIEKLYDKKVKFLYWEIINYAAAAQANNDEKYHNDFYKIKVTSRNIAETIKTMIQVQKNLQRYLRSTNIEIKAQYEKIVFEVINMILDINKLKNAKNNDERLNAYVNIEKAIDKNNLINNWDIDRLIREHKISNEMATSLINDSNYKNEMFKNLLQVSEAIFNNEISQNQITELKNKKSINWLEDNFWLSWKKLQKTIAKLKKKAKKIKEKLEDEKNKFRKTELKEKLENINFFIKKYRG